MSQFDVEQAHGHSMNNRETLSRSEMCGCFSCFVVIPVARITRWVDTGETAVCPECGVDSIIGDAAKIPLTEEFLDAMYQHWFTAAHK